MLGLCEISSCRRQVLLRYFGEQAEPCGNCDNCIAPPEVWDATVSSQKALSCVYRTGQRFGAGHVVDVLLGKSTPKVQEFGHQQLSTFSIGKELNEKEWRSVFRQLVARGMLTVEVESWGALKLGDTCRPLLRGEQSITLRRDPVVSQAASGRKKRGGQSVASGDQLLWDTLRQTRKQLAEDQSVPPYVIFSDASLMEMLAVKPVTEQQFLSIAGVGATKLERYGKSFMAVIDDYLQTHGDNSISSSSNTVWETQALLLAGMAVNAIAEQRQLSPTTVFNHCAQLLEEGRVALEAVIDIDDKHLQLASNALHEHGMQADGNIRIKPAYEALDGLIEYAQLRCIAASMMAKSS
jgi:ATP-dependent DNA helicase RecQ